MSHDGGIEMIRRIWEAFAFCVLMPLLVTALWVWLLRVIVTAVCA